jgi:hypothetical protein
MVRLGVRNLLLTVCSSTDFFVPFDATSIKALSANYLFSMVSSQTKRSNSTYAKAGSIVYTVRKNLAITCLCQRRDLRSNELMLRSRQFPLSAPFSL